MAENFNVNEINALSPLIQFNSDSLTIENNGTTEEIKYINIQNVFIKKRKFVLNSSGNKTFKLDVNNKQERNFDKIVDEISLRAQIGVNEPKKCRSKIIKNHSLENSVPTFIVCIIMGMQIATGFALLLLPIGIYLFVPIVGLGVFVIYIVTKDSMFAIDGVCPICKTSFKTNRNQKQLECKACLRTILILPDYYEIEVSENYFDDFDISTNDYDDDEEYIN